MFDKAKYWANRKAGKRGQGERVMPEVVERGFTRNRASRREKLPSDPKFTKVTR